MAERATIARPYAKAAFEYARDAHDFAGWSQGLARAAEIGAWTWHIGRNFVRLGAGKAHVLRIGA